MSYPQQLWQPVTVPWIQQLVMQPYSYFVPFPVPVQPMYPVPVVLLAGLKYRRQELICVHTETMFVLDKTDKYFPLYCLRFASRFCSYEEVQPCLSRTFCFLSRNVLCTGKCNIVIDIGIICLTVEQLCCSTDRTVTFGCNTSSYSGLINRDTFVHPTILPQNTRNRYMR